MVNAQFTGSTWHTPVPLWAIVTSFGAGIDIFGTAPGHGYALLSTDFYVFDTADFFMNVWQTHIYYFFVNIAKIYIIFTIKLNLIIWMTDSLPAVKN